MNIKTMISGLTIALLASMGAQAKELRHAELAIDGQAIVKAAQANGHRLGEETTVYCQAVVAAHGAVDAVTCYNNEGQQPLAETVALAVDQQNIWPAHVGGKAIAVRANFRVVFHQQDSQLQAEVLPNLGALQAQYGARYVEPQERLDEKSWAEYVTAAKNRVAESFFAHADGHVKVAATVSHKTGKAYDVGVVAADRPYRKDAIELRSGLKKSKFIPGYVDGKPVTMPYLAIMSFEK